MYYDFHFVLRIIKTLRTWSFCLDVEHKGWNTSFHIILYPTMIKNELGLITLSRFLLVELLYRSNILHYMKKIIYVQNTVNSAQCYNAVRKGSLSFSLFILWALIISRRNLVSILKLAFFSLVNWQRAIEEK